MPCSLMYLNVALRTKATNSEGPYYCLVMSSYIHFMISQVQDEREAFSTREPTVYGSTSDDWFMLLDSTLLVLHINLNMKIILIVVTFFISGGTVPLELSPITTTVPTSALSNSSDTTWPSAGLSPQPTSKGSNRAATAGLTDTTVVIIVSVSLALLVCAIIPLIFYGHWRSSGENQTTAGDKTGEDSDEHTDIPLTQTTVALQTDDTDDETPDSAQYASVYQALDPQSLD